MEKFGTIYVTQNDQIQEKIRKTCLERYGVEHPSKCPEIAAKMSKGQTEAIVLFHWLTGEEVICVASYEVAVVKHLNNQKVNYVWQKQVFTMPDGKTYRPDLYLPETDMWIEIKGYFRKDAEEKWNWFHNEHPNSELWNKTKLKEIGIL